jgi:hypothetical protein
MTDMIFQLGARNSCSNTINGWIWYCDEHDTHGNADTEEEADHMAAAHVEFWEAEDAAWAAANPEELIDPDGDGEPDDYEYDGCAIYVVLAKSD